MRRRRPVPRRRCGVAAVRAVTSLPGVTRVLRLGRRGPRPDRVPAASPAPGARRTGQHRVPPPAGPSRWGGCLAFVPASSPCLSAAAGLSRIALTCSRLWQQESAIDRFHGSVSFVRTLDFGVCPFHGLCHIRRPYASLPFPVPVPCLPRRAEYQGLPHAALLFPWALRVWPAELPPLPLSKTGLS